jgi:hypothetical protein
LSGCSFASNPTNGPSTSVESGLGAADTTLAATMPQSRLNDLRDMPDVLVRVLSFKASRSALDACAQQDHAYGSHVDAFQMMSTPLPAAASTAR